MTEAEWLAATDPTPLFELVRGTASDRKLRLFHCAIRRWSWDFIPDSSKAGIEASEHFADGIVSQEVLSAALRRAEAEASTIPRGMQRTHAYQALGAMELEMQPYPIAGFWTGEEEESAACPLHRCIFGNPFRPVSLDQESRTSTAVAIAQSMYDSRDFSPMPLLADALQDAGCENEDILNHCRSGGPHVRGCWVVDLILGKA